MKIKDETFLEVVNKLEKFKVRLETHRLHRDPEREQLYEKFAKKMEVGCKSIYRTELFHPSGTVYLISHYTAAWFS